MAPALNAGAVIVSAPRVTVKRTAPRVGVVVAAPAIDCGAAPESAPPKDEDSGGDDSEPPSLADYWHHSGPTLVCPGLGIFASRGA